MEAIALLRRRGEARRGEAASGEAGELRWERECFICVRVYQGEYIDCDMV